MFVFSEDTTFEPPIPVWNFKNLSYFSIFSVLNINKGQVRLGEPPRSILEPHFFDNLLQTFEKLIKLGFTYYNGKVAVVGSSDKKN